MALTARFLASADPPPPTTLADWQQQIGALQYFSHNVPGLGLTLSVPQTFLNEQIQALGVPSRSASTLKRYAPPAPPPVLDAIRNAWKAVRERPLLAHYNPNDVVVLVTDASSLHGWSAVYLTADASAWASFCAGEVALESIDFDIIGCRSGTWTPVQRTWAVHRQEFYALVTAVVDAPFFFLGARFAVLCDNADTVLWLRNDTISRLNPVTHAWALRWLERLAMFDFLVYHNPGASPFHFVADIISRHPRASALTLNALEPSHNADGAHIDSFAFPSLSEIRLLTAEDPTYAARAGPEGLARRDNGNIDVPPGHDLRVRFLILAHTGHRGADALVHTIRRHGFDWDTLAADAAKFVSECFHCRVNRGPPLSHVPLGTVPIGQSFNDIVTLDHMSMTPSAEGYTDVLVLLDTFSRYLVLVPVNSTSAASTVSSFISRWVAYYGPPAALLSDSGPGFAAALAQGYAEAAGITWHTTTPNMPRTHGSVERCIRDLRHLFNVTIAEAHLRKADWATILPVVAFAYNNAPAASLGHHAPIEVAFGIPPRDPVHTIINEDRPVNVTVPPDFAQHVAALHQSLTDIRGSASSARSTRRAREHAAVPNEMPNYSPGDWVLVPDLSDPNAPTWTLLAQVISRESPFVYSVRLATPPHDELRRHVAHIRAFDDSAYAAPANLLEAAARYRDAPFPFEDFLDFRRSANGRTFEVLVRWEGFPASQDKWEPLTQLLRDAKTYTRTWFLAARDDPRFQDPGHVTLLRAIFNSHPILSKGAM
jgi:hypothetical protein